MKLYYQCKNCGRKLIDIRFCEKCKSEDVIDGYSDLLEIRINQRESYNSDELDWFFSPFE